MVIKWSSLARQSLKEIYQFYLPNTGKEKARNIVNELKRETRNPDSLKRLLNSSVP